MIRGFKTIFIHIWKTKAWKQVLRLHWEMTCLGQTSSISRKSGSYRGSSQDWNILFCVNDLSKALPYATPTGLALCRCWNNSFLGATAPETPHSYCQRDRAFQTTGQTATGWRSLLWACATSTRQERRPSARPRGLPSLASPTELDIQTLSRSLNSSTNMFETLLKGKKKI